MDVKTEEAVKVEAWVLKCYLELGLNQEQAETLLERGVDHHTVARFLARGCTPELVVRILI